MHVLTNELYYYTHGTIQTITSNMCKEEEKQHTNTVLWVLVDV